MSEEKKRLSFDERKPYLEKIPVKEWVWSDEAKDYNSKEFLKDFVWVFENEILRKYEKDNPRVFDQFNPDCNSDLPRALCKLWTAHVKNFREKGKAWEDTWLWSDPEVWEEIKEQKKHLIKHGREWEHFWFEKKYFDKFIECLQSYVEEKTSAVDKFIKWLQSCVGRKSPVEEKFSERVEKIIGWTLGHDEGRERKEEKIKGAVGEEQIKGVVEKIKKSNRDFIDDLKEIRGQLKKNFRGMKYYVKQFTKWFLPWATFTLIAVSLFIKCNGGG